MKITVIDATINYRQFGPSVMKIHPLKYSGRLDSLIISYGYAHIIDGGLRTSLTTQAIIHMIKSLKIESSMSDSEIATKLTEDVQHSRFLIESSFKMFFPDISLDYDEKKQIK